MGDYEDRTCYIGNFTSAVTVDLLEELFTQVGPVEKVTLADRNSYRFALVTFEDEESVPFAVKTLDGIRLFNTPLRVKPHRDSKHAAVRSERPGSFHGYHSHNSRSKNSRNRYGHRWHSNWAAKRSLAWSGTLAPPGLQPPHSSSLNYNRVDTRSVSTPYCISKTSTGSSLSERHDGGER